MQPKLTWNHCNTLQRTATHCNTLQRPAAHCNTLRLGIAATCCKTKNAGNKNTNGGNKMQPKLTWNHCNTLHDNTAY